MLFRGIIQSKPNLTSLHFPLDAGCSVMYNMKSKLKSVFKMEEVMKRFCRLALVCLMTMLLACCAAAEENTVVTTSFPCYDFVRQVAGEHCTVELLIRPGTEVHSYEPSPADILKIGSADLFVCVGGESDVWAEDILASFGADAPMAVHLIESVEALEAGHDHNHGHEGHDHGQIQWDEHIWTSPKNAVKMVRMVEDALCAAMPDFAADFSANADVYAAQIEEIDAQLMQIVAESKRSELIFADRFPFLYMAHDYGIKYSAAFESCASDTEPSAQTMVALIQRIMETKAPAVYILEMSTGTIARTLAEETGVDVLTLHSAQTVTQQEFDAGESYVTLMQKNLDAIRVGLN